MLGAQQAKTLRGVGFTQYEVDEFNNAVAPDGLPQSIDLESATWHCMMISRKEFIMDMIKHGLTTIKIEKLINDYYKMDRDRSPFDFVKKEYKPPRGLTNYQKARAARAKRQTDSLYSYRPKKKKKH